MKSLLFLNLRQQTCLKKTSVNNKSYQLCYRTDSNRSTFGFTLLEVLVAIVIVGILSAIAAPSWLSFVARQRLNKANDTVLAALREAQQKAKNTKLSYSVSFTTENKQPKVSIHRRDTKPVWDNLGREVGVNTEKFLLGTNLQDRNDIKSNLSYAAKFENNPQTITFNHLGILESKKNNSPSDTGLKVILAIPKVKTPTQASDVKRCVIVETLIGGIRTAKNDDCD